MTKTDLTPKQKSIIAFIFQFRYADRLQIQRFLTYKTASYLNVLLADLVEKNYLSQFYTRSLLERNKPAVYCLSSNGIRCIANEFHVSTNVLMNRYRDRKLSKQFRSHCLLRTTIYLQYQSKYFDTFQFQLSDSFPEFSALTELLPDAVITTPERQYLLEIIEPSLPRFRQISRIQRYFTYILDGSIEEELQSVPTILFITASEQLQKQFMRYIKRARREKDSEDEVRILLTTREMVETHNVTDTIWDEV